jgi:putative nucleotide binding protein
MKDDYVIVLDFFPRGKPTDRRSEPLAQCIGDTYFNLLEVVIRDNVTVKPKDRIYVGDGKRNEVKYIKGKISLNELTNFSKGILEEVILDIVSKNEKRFLDFFNKAGPISTRSHTLELLHGIGKKHMWNIINERKKKPFESFSDIEKRIPMLPDVKKIIVKRIMDELEGKDRYKLFVSTR